MGQENRCANRPVEHVHFESGSQNTGRQNCRYVTYIPAVLPLCDLRGSFKMNEKKRVQTEAEIITSGDGGSICNSMKSKYEFHTEKILNY